MLLFFSEVDEAADFASWPLQVAQWFSSPSSALQLPPLALRCSSSFALRMLHFLSAALIGTTPTPTPLTRPFKLRSLTITGVSSLDLVAPAPPRLLFTTLMFVVVAGTAEVAEDDDFPDEDEEPLT